MGQFKKPLPGQDLSQRDLAAALAEDEKAAVKAELDLGLDDDPDLRTRPGQPSLLRPRPKSRLVPTIVVVALLAIAAAGAWITGVLERLGGPTPPRAVQELLGTAAPAATDSAPTPAPARPKAKAPAGRRARSPGSK